MPAFAGMTLTFWMPPGESRDHAGMTKEGSLFFQ
jgi:hypothetical protein